MQEIYIVYKILIAYLIVLFACQTVYLYAFNESSFFRVGPSQTLTIAGVCVDTWGKWVLFMLIIATTQTVKVLADELISPWIIINVMDTTKRTILNLTQVEVHLMCQTYYLFSGIVSFVKVMVYISQIDFVAILIMVDCVVSFITTRHYLDGKQFISDVYTLNNDSKKIAVV